MVTTNTKKLLLTDLKGLKGFVDVHWAVPYFTARNILDEKAGGEGVIDVPDWRNAVQYAYERHMPVDAETKLLMNRAKEMNSTYGPPDVAVMWPRWMSEALDEVDHVSFGIRSLDEADESQCRQALVMYAVKRSLREVFLDHLKHVIRNKGGKQPEWEHIDTEPMGSYQDLVQVTFG